MKFRDLEKVRVIVKDATGLDISYAYDDLVFPDHTAFIIQFDDTDENNFFCYFHEDCIAGERKRIIKKLTEECSGKGCTIYHKGSFYLKQKGEEVGISFNKA